MTFATVMTIGILGGVCAYLKTPRSADHLPLSHLYHGTTTRRFPDAKVGATFRVTNHLFFATEPGLPIAYARDEGASVYREIDLPAGRASRSFPVKAKPLVLRVVPVNPEATWQRGAFSGAPYFPDGTELRIVGILHPEPPIAGNIQRSIYWMRGLHCSQD